MDKIRVYKFKSGHRKDMWTAYCKECNERYAFWFFGETLGHTLEHIRRNHGN